MLPSTKFEFYCLSWIADDFENVQIIKNALLTNDKIDAGENDILIALLNLVEARLAQAYVYDVTKQKYIEAKPSADLPSENWFWITQAGINALNENRKAKPEWWDADRR